MESRRTWTFILLIMTEQQQQPITPPPELVRQWTTEAASANIADERYIAIAAARWGADQQLEICRKWLEDQGYHPEVPRDMYNDCRPNDKRRSVLKQFKSSGFKYSHPKLYKEILVVLEEQLNE